MCLLALDWQPGTPVPLRLIGNRDEFHARPAAPLHRWATASAPQITLLGGRDEQAGGTWLAANAFGTVAALTNVRDPGEETPANAPSRGELVCRALTCRHLPRWLDELANSAHQYAGFNLLVATPERLWHLHHRRGAATLNTVAPGIHGLSNADLDTPWPKVEALRHAARQWPAHGDFPGPALAAIQDDRQAADSALPDTGVGLSLERTLSSAFIRGDTYGTRATTWLSVTAAGRVAMTEQRFMQGGQFIGSASEAIG
ncbi:NRDE family protein [Vreelandella jeotgali]|uniref:NRDE family protein n=1 Tax=Vreelandella jeotgali TaxID=553386 RepID=UPI00034A2EAF|nr:NRDE family protein [Halomonas jeotgali]